MKKSGFTLIELLTVIAILAILAVGIIAAINPIGQINKAQDTETLFVAYSIKNAIENYTVGVGKPPWCADTCPTTPIDPISFDALLNNDVTPVPVYQVLQNLGEFNANFVTKELNNDFTKIFFYSLNPSQTITLCFLPISSAQQNNFQTRFVNNYGVIDTSNQCKSHGGSQNCYICFGNTYYPNEIPSPSSNPSPSVTPIVLPTLTYTPIPPNASIVPFPTSGHLTPTPTSPATDL